MNWLRLYITVEGQAEKAFADLALTPHLANFEIDQSEARQTWWDTRFREDSGRFVALDESRPASRSSVHHHD